jgi:hypothetical protein
VAKGACHDEDYVWVGAASQVYAVGVGNSSADSVLLTGHIRGQQPFGELATDGLAITHSGTAGTAYTGRIYGKLEGVAEADSGPHTIPDPDQDETSRAQFGQRGKYLRVQVTAAGTTAWGYGPLWLEVTEEAGDGQ